jgi:hypothetical protein
VVEVLPSNANGESSLRPFSSFYNWHLATQEASWTIKDLMRVTMLNGVEAAIVGMGVTIVRVRHDE